MQALLAKYLARPTIQNAERIRVYNQRHMMASCLLCDQLELAIYNEAIFRANNIIALKKAA